MVKYEFKHPNHGWQGIQAPCDARNFALLMDWEVRTEPMHYWFSHAYQMFSLVMSIDDHTLQEVVSSISYGEWNGYSIQQVYSFREGDENPKLVPTDKLRGFDCQIVKVCPASDPAGMAMPLRVQSGDLWMLSIPEEVFGTKGAYVRLVVPKELVR